MVAISLKQFGGAAPAIESRLLPEHMAEYAANLDVSNGSLDSYAAPRAIYTFPGAHQRAYRLPNYDGTAFVWLALDSQYASPVRSPLANDTLRRVYWTSGPGNTGAPYWTTYARIEAGLLPYRLGIVIPPNNVALIVSSPGPTPAPVVERSYVATYFNEFGEESPPNLPSAPLSGSSSGIWMIEGLPTTAPPNPSGVNYPPVTGVYLYRTITGAESGGEFFRVATFSYVGAGPAPTVAYLDALPDNVAVSNPVLETEGWGNPPTNLDGLTALPGGMMVGFVGNTVHFSEVNRPHTWPAAYDLSLLYDIVGMTYWHQSLVVLTRGYPSVGTGLTPAAFTFQQIHASEPCISRASIVTDLSGVFYASNNGLVQLNHKGVVNHTDTMIGEDQWVNEFKAAQIMGCRHKSQYIGMIQNNEGGWALDFAEKRRGVTKLLSFLGATMIWNDEYTGDTYVMAGATVYQWDWQASEVNKMIYVWRSKRLFYMFPNNYGACQVSLHPDVEIPPSGPAPPLDYGSENLLPADVNAQITIRAFPYTYGRNLTKRNEIFRLPSGFLSFDWQVEIISRVPIYSVELASTMRELRKVPAIKSTTTTTKGGEGYAET